MNKLVSEPCAPSPHPREVCSESQPPYAPSYNGARCDEYQGTVLVRSFDCNGSPADVSVVVAETENVYATTPSVPPMAPPSACLPELEPEDCTPVLNPTPERTTTMTELPRTGQSFTEPALGFVGFLVVVGSLLCIVAGWRRWRENRHLRRLALLEADARREGYGALGADYLKDRPA